jgi:hypothetical protein
MKPRDNRPSDQPLKAEQRKSWVKPELQKIKAGDAEVGTRAAGDGAYTTS